MGMLVTVVVTSVVSFTIGATFGAASVLSMSTEQFAMYKEKMRSRTHGEYQYQQNYNR